MSRLLRAFCRSQLKHVDPRGRVPFRQWLQGLKDRKAAAIIEARLTRIQVGLFGDAKSVGTGVKELKIDYGPGYRVYFGEDDRKVVVLLIGGTKKSQSTDIKRAQRYWAEYMET